MGFFDSLKKGAEIAKNTVDKAVELQKKKLARMSDAELLDLKAQGKGNGSLISEEMSKRGLS